MRASIYAAIEGRTLKITNPEKVLYPADGTTKWDVVRYYARVAHAILPHLRDRPLTLKRYPNGVEEPYFYEKQCPGHRPAWIRTIQKGEIDYCVADDRAGLAWLASLACIELHPLLSRRGSLDHADFAVFDLDPGHPAAILECAKVALFLKDRLSALGLEALVKTSGFKGLQLYVPLNSGTPYAVSRAFARDLAIEAEQAHPSLATSVMARSERFGRVYIDWQQNDPGKTTVAVYSLRATATPQISCPMLWAELEDALASGSGQAFRFGREEVAERIGRFGDLFAGANTVVQRLPGRLRLAKA